MEPATALLLASAASSAAGMYNNQRNIQYAGKVNQESVELANTAHQREVRDLEAAGLNPVLSAQSSGAPVPQLSTPSLDPIDGGIGHNATSLARALSGDMKAEKELKISQKEVNSAQSYNLRQDGHLKRAQARLIDEGFSSASKYKNLIDGAGSWLGEKYIQLRDGFRKDTNVRHYPFKVDQDGVFHPNKKYGLSERAKFLKGK